MAKNLLTASQTIEPFKMGTTWVKLNPESTTIIHWGDGAPVRAYSLPYGITEAAER